MGRRGQGRRADPRKVALQARRQGLRGHRGGREAGGASALPCLDPATSGSGAALPRHASCLASTARDRAHKVKPPARSRVRSSSKKTRLRTRLDSIRCSPRRARARRSTRLATAPACRRQQGAPCRDRRAQGVLPLASRERGGRRYARADVAVPPPAILSSALPGRSTPAVAWLGGRCAGFAVLWALLRSRLVRGASEVAAKGVGIRTELSC